MIFLNRFVIGTLLFGSCFSVFIADDVEAKKEKSLYNNSAVYTLAVVDGEAITNLDVSKRLKLIQVLSQNSSLENDSFFRDIILESLIQEKVKASYAKRRFKEAGQPFVVSSQEIAEEISNMGNSYGLQTKDFIKALEDQGVDLLALQDHIKNDLTWNTFINAKYGSLIELSNSDVKSYRKNLEKNYKKRAYGVERLFFPYQAFRGDRTRAKTLVNKLVGILNSGVNFDLIARLFSSLSSTTGNGSYGYITVGQLPFKEENQKLECMNAGDTKILELNSGISLMRVYSVRASANEAQEIVTLKYVLDPVSLDDQEELSIRFAKFTENIKRHKNADELLKSAKGYNYKISEDNTMSLKELPEEMQKIVKTLKTNEFSDAIVTPDGIMVVCLKKKENLKIKVPGIKECKNKLYEDKLNTMSDCEYRNALNSVLVEKKGCCKSGFSFK